MIKPEEYFNDKHIKEMMVKWGEPVHQHIKLLVDQYFWLSWGGKWQIQLGEVMFLLPRPGGLLLHRKSLYPPNCWRLLTGRIKPAEKLTDTLNREIMEEVGLSLPIKRYVGIVTYEISHNRLTLPWVTHIFLMGYSDAPLQPSFDDEIEETKVCSLQQLDQVANDLERLPKTWHDWGRYRAIAHRLVRQHVKAEELEAP